MIVSARKKIFVIAVVSFCITAIAVIFVVFKKLESSDMFVTSGVSTLSDITFKNIEAQELSVSSLRGRPVVLSIWASWCSLCMRQIADLSALQQEFGDNVTIIAVNRGESLDVVKKYIDQYDSGHNLIFVLDANDLLYTEIKGFSMPETVFLDKDGNIRDHTRGIINIVELRRRIENLIDRPTD